jgi:hypothetical protein
MKSDLLVTVVLCVLAWIAVVSLLALIVRLTIKTFAFVQGDEYDLRLANTRAEELLSELLDASELSQLKEAKYLDVASTLIPDRIYRIPLEDGMVRVFEGGWERVRLCIQPTRPLPRHDVIAMHKLMIEGNELEYLSKANRFPPLSPEPGPLTPARSYRI